MARTPKVADTAAKSTPDFPTMVKKRFRDGRIVGIDDSVWLYRAVPLAPVSEARTAEDAVNAGHTIQQALNGLAGMVRLRNKQRNMNKAGYRQVHMLLVNIPQYYEPPADHPNYAYLKEGYADLLTYRRALVLGVRLNAQLGNGSLRSAFDSAVESIVRGGTPMSDYDQDFEAVDQVLTRAGLFTPNPADFRYLNGWFNYGMNSDVPIVYHDNHVHFFQSGPAARAAARVGLDDCDSWLDMHGTHALTFAAVESFELPYVSVYEDTGRWASRLIESDVTAISIRGKVEPPQVTREVMRKQIVDYRQELEERREKNKLDRAELDEKSNELQQVERDYASGAAPATLIDASVVVAMPGIVDDVNATSAASVVQMSAMQNRQPGALAEMMLASSIGANPYLEDLPATTIAYSGLPSLSNVGDKDGVLFGVTERDRQPVYLSHTAVSDEDTPPLMLVAAGSGSGKTMLLLNLADQQARAGVPNVIVDPKTGSDHSAAVLASGGQVVSLDDLVSSDGALDPLRFAASPEVGVDMAASALLTVNPWGPEIHLYEVPLYTAIARGVSLGATCTGQALQLAYQAEQDPRHRELLERVIGPIFRLAEQSALVRAFFGINPSTRALRVANGITYIKVGDYRLELPTPGTPREHLTVPQRLAVATVKMMFTGAGMALTGRDGVLHMDEAWVVTGTTPEEAERAGRLARSQRFLPILYSQDMSGAINANLMNHVSRMAIGPLDDANQARMALQIAKLEETKERIDRITARKTIGVAGDEVAPNWHSLRPLSDPKTRQNLRGTIFIFSDLAGRAVPTEVKLSPQFLARASTNRIDVNLRNQQAGV
ncbi:ATP-binding protein [Agromyces humi]|uniref:ATP-binding protein n=1 Tax=Agromyces humi TaxID=1766800 RepID=UPI00135A83A6|nr:ATP-binding protein [Agromyces humi]